MTHAEEAAQSVETAKRTAGFILQTFVDVDTRVLVSWSEPWKTVHHRVGLSFVLWFQTVVRADGVDATEVAMFSLQVLVLAFVDI